jgi:hypothetical protein
LAVIAQLARVHDPNARVTVCDIPLPPRIAFYRVRGASPVRTLTGVIRPDLSTADLLLLVEEEERDDGRVRMVGAPEIDPMRDTLRVWDLATGQLVREVSPGGAFYHAYLSALDGSGRGLFVSYQTVCRLVHLETGTLLYRFAARGVYGHTVGASIRVVDGRTFMIAGDGYWELRDAAEVTSRRTEHLKGALKWG